MPNQPSYSKKEAPLTRLFEYSDHEIFCHHTIDTSPDPKSFSMHVHERAEIFYLISGIASCVVEGTVYHLEPGNIIITRSAESHMIVIRSRQPYERISIQFSQNILLGIDPTGLLLQPLQDRPLGCINHYSETDFSQNPFLLFFQKRSSNYSKGQKRLYVLNIIFSVMINIYDSYIQREKEISSLYVEGRAQKILSYINKELFKGVSLSTISKEFFMSKSQISRIFKNTTGVSIGEYIRQKRLIAVRERIIEGEKASLAYSSCGFNDYSSFFRAYKAQFGYAPSKTIPKHLRNEADTE